MFQNVRPCGTLRPNIESSHSSDIKRHEKVGPRLAGGSLVFRNVIRSPCASGLLEAMTMEVPKMDHTNSDPQTLLESSRLNIIFVCQVCDVPIFPLRESVVIFVTLLCLIS
jgi:hypothetical protein